MSITVEIQESDLTQIISKSIHEALRYTTSDYSCGPLAKKLVEMATHSLQRQAAELNIDQLVREASEKYIIGIVEDVVKRKIADYARATVKEMKDRGELFSAK